MVQAVHAAHEIGKLTIGTIVDSLVLCETESEVSLLEAARELQTIGIEHIVFRENDLNDQATALATQPLTQEQRKQLAHWQLWRS